MLANPNRPNGGILAEVRRTLDPRHHLQRLDAHELRSEQPADHGRHHPAVRRHLGLPPIRSTCSRSSTPSWAWRSCTPATTPPGNAATARAVPGHHLLHDSDADRSPADAAEHHSHHRPLVATALDPFVRVLVEAGYSRTANPGAPNPPFYWHPLQTLMNLVAAIPVAIDNVLSYIAGNPNFRPLGTLSAVVNPVRRRRTPVDAGRRRPYGPPPPCLDGRGPAPMMFSARSPDPSRRRRTRRSRRRCRCRCSRSNRIPL